MKGVYIHIPFCKSKCLYCGFNSSAGYDEHILQEYLEAIIKIAPHFDLQNADTIFIGGGTPTVITPKIFDSFLYSLSKNIDLTKLKEFTIEANPESITVDHILVFNAYKVNRISLGAQSFDDKVLKFLGRIHNSKDILTSFRNIRKYHPDCKINLDIIFDIPGVENHMKHSLYQTISLSPEHISAYNYSFDTGFLQQYKANNEKTNFYALKEYLQNYGYEKYEISNFAKNGNICIHNKKYWNMDEYVGLGVSSHSMLEFSGKRIRFAFTEKLNEFIDLFKIPEYELISPEVMFKEDIIFVLRLTEGIDVEKILKKYDYPLSEFKKRISSLMEEKLLELKENILCLSKKGELFLDYVQEYLWEVL